jgi:putative FmdB family regulatory protein
MPTYEYACRDCGLNLEVVQSFTDDPLETCEHCGGRLRKVFSAAGIIFKGSGYYVTDTRSDRSRSAVSTSSGDRSEGAASGSEDAASGSKDAASGSKDATGSGSSSSTGSGSSSSTGSGTSSSSEAAGSTSSSGSSASDAKSA